MNNKNEQTINLNIKIDSQSDTSLESKTDSDEYIDLSYKVNENIKQIFQFQLFDEKLIIKYIGKSSETPDIIIAENFGPDKNFSLYNCVYSKDEFEINKNKVDKLALYYPIVKLVIKKVNCEIISCIAIKLEQEIEYEKEIKEWCLYWVENSNNSEYIKTLKLKKDINQSNILEKIINLIINKDTNIE